MRKGTILPKGFVTSQAFLIMAAKERLIISRRLVFASIWRSFAAPIHTPNSLSRKRNPSFCCTSFDLIAVELSHVGNYVQRKIAISNLHGMRIC